MNGVSRNKYRDSKQLKLVCARNTPGGLSAAAAQSAIQGSARTSHHKLLQTTSTCRIWVHGILTIYRDYVMRAVQLVEIHAYIIYIRTDSVAFSSASAFSLASVSLSRASFASAACLRCPSATAAAVPHPRLIYPICRAAKQS